MAAVAIKLLPWRTYAAVQLPRLVRTAAGASSRRSMSAAAAANTDATSKATEIRGQLQRKKEELYSLLDLVEREHLYGGLNYVRYLVERDRNIKLLQRLSVQVDPKPSDPNWRWDRGMQVFNHLALCVTSVLAGVGVGCLLDPATKEEEDGHDDDDGYDYDPEEIAACLRREQVKTLGEQVKEALKCHEHDSQN